MAIYDAFWHFMDLYGTFWPFWLVSLFGGEFTFVAIYTLFRLKLFGTNLARVKYLSFCMSVYILPFTCKLAWKQQ